MARAVYSHELIDPDFAWLIASFQEDHPQYLLIESVGLPLLFVERAPLQEQALLPLLPGDESEVEGDGTSPGE